MSRRGGPEKEKGDELSIPAGPLPRPALENPGPDLVGLLRLLAEKRKRGVPLALVVITAARGSTPRKPGTAMLVGADGTAAGTVGGGALEAQVVAAARQALREGRSGCRAFSLTPREAADDGMICGGNLEVLVDCLDAPGSAHGEILTRARRDWEAGRECLLVYSLDNRDDVTAREEQMPPPEREAVPKGGLTGAGNAPADKAVTIGLGLLSGDEFVIGTLASCGAEPPELAAAVKKASRRRSAVLLNMGPRRRFFLLPLTSPITVVIAGAGHIARPLSTLCRFAGFRTTIIDDRPEFAGRESFPAADRIVITPSFANCFREAATGPEDFIVIATRGHLSDAAVLAQALRTGAAYIGMIGSRKKRETVYRQLAGEGFSPEALARVHCPVGLAIGAQTPEEIAVSIVAELIAVRSGPGQTT